LHYGAYEYVEIDEDVEEDFEEGSEEDCDANGTPGRSKRCLDIALAEGGTTVIGYLRFGWISFQ
jgi:hypothetical protein